MAAGSTGSGVESFDAATDPYAPDAVAIPDAVVQPSGEVTRVQIKGDNGSVSLVTEVVHRSRWPPPLR